MGLGKGGESGIIILKEFKTESVKCIVPIRCKAKAEKF
jgi:hypothetical protein